LIDATGVEDDLQDAALGVIADGVKGSGADGFELHETSL
jgi:hypothetical protein